MSVNLSVYVSLSGFIFGSVGTRIPLGNEDSRRTLPVLKTGRATRPTHSKGTAEHSNIRVSGSVG